MYFDSSIITIVKHISLFLFIFLFYNLYTFSSIWSQAFILLMFYYIYHYLIDAPLKRTKLSVSSKDNPSLYTISWLVHKQSTNIKSIFVLLSYIYFWFMYSSALFGLMWLYNRWVGFMAIQKLALLSLVCEVC